MGIVAGAANEIVRGSQVVSNGSAEAYVIEITTIGPDARQPAILNAPAAARSPEPRHGMLGPDAVRQPVVSCGVHGPAAAINDRAAGRIGIEREVSHCAGSKIEDRAQRVCVGKWHVAINPAV